MLYFPVSEGPPRPDSPRYTSPGEGDRAQLQVQGDQAVTPNSFLEKLLHSVYCAGEFEFEKALLQLSSTPTLIPQSESQLL